MSSSLLSSPLLHAALGMLGLAVALVGLRRGRHALRQRAGQQGLAEQERDFVLTRLSAEVAHELAALRLYLRDIVAHAPLEQVDREIGHDEVARLERLLERLRQVRRAEEPRSAQPLLPAVQRALARVPALRHKRLQVDVDVRARAQVHAAPGGLEMLLVSLLRHAAAAAPACGNVAVRLRPEAAGLLLDVEDDGPALPEPLRGPVFHPLDLLGCGAPGLDLLVALGVAREQAWRLSWMREQGRTVFRLHLPAADRVPLRPGRAA